MSFGSALKRTLSMKIGLNTTALLWPKSGIGQYVQQLSQRLVNNSSVDLEFFCGLRWGGNASPGAETRAVFNRYASVNQKTSSIPGASFATKKLKSVMRQVAFSFGARSRNIDLYHEPNFISFKCDRPTVITVHDMSPFRLAGHHKPDLVKLFEEKLPGAVARASAIIVDSVFVKHEVIEYFPGVADKVFPVLLAAGPEFMPRAQPECLGFLDSQRLSYKKYILAVGTLEPRKNLLSALRAYAKLPEPVRKEFPFVIAGMKGWLHGRFEAEAEPLIQKGQIRMLGYISDEDLPRLYSCATLMVYPSIYEGFGLPPLESMACGTPVVTSNVASLPEVIGTAGIAVDPNDVDALSLAMREILENPALATKLSQLGLAQACKFSWEKTAEDTVTVYRKVLGL